MAEPLPLQLDGDLWVPTPLGTIGPHRWLAEVVHGGDWSYRPLLRHHLAPGWLTEHTARTVQLIDDRAAWDALGDEPEVAPHRSTGRPSRWDDERSVAVVLRDSRGEQFQGVILADLNPYDSRLANLTLFWLWNAIWVEASRAEDTLAAGWLTLFRALAHRGVVGVSATETWMGRRFVAMLHDIAGFRPGTDVMADLGLSPADAQQIVCEWAATIDDGTVARFATRPELDADAHRCLVTLLSTYVTVANVGQQAIDPTPGFRQTLRGDVALDGARGWGTGPRPGDWYEAPPDTIPEGADWTGRSPAVLAHWLRTQAP